MEWIGKSKEEELKEDKGKWVEVVGSEFWQPEKEDEEVVGNIIQIVESKYGKEYIIEVGENERITTPAHMMLQNKLAGCKVGDNIKIVYRGEVPSGKGSPLKKYRVFKYAQAN